LEDNIKTDIKETGGKDVDGICVSQYRDQQQAVMKMIMNLRDP
jgi:hypothetical protein